MTRHRIRARRDPSQPTAAELVRALDEELSPLFRGYLFHVYHPKPLGGEDGFIVKFARTSPNASEIEALNAPVSLMVHVKDTVGYGAPLWRWGQPAPSRIVAEQFKGRGIRMTKKTGAPLDVARYVARWFQRNAAALKGSGEARDGTRRRRWKGLHEQADLVSEGQEVL